MKFNINELEIILYCLKEQRNQHNSGSLSFDIEEIEDKIKKYLDGDCK